MTVDVVKESNYEVYMKLSGYRIPGVISCFCFTNWNVFFEIYRGSHTDPNNFLKVYDSDPIPNNESPTFP